MGKILGHLEPKRVWDIFEEICQIPRPSKKEQRIARYILDFAVKHDLETRQDKTGNIVVLKKATKGNENLKTVVLQSHIDMVCEKDSDVEHDFNTDPIRPRIDNGWVKATGTTLGADDGIGMAVQLAILESGSIEHGPVECLFTVDEETGLTGAFSLEKDLLQGRILLNLDSEDEGELFIGCAGGIDTQARFGFIKEIPDTNYKHYKIFVSGLKGGHSGDDINKHRGNANKILNRILWDCERMFDIRLSHIDGGNLHNAIPREAYAVVAVPSRHLKSFEELVLNLMNELKTEFRINEPDLNITLVEAEKPDFVIDPETQNNLLNALYACPHGVMAMSPDITDLVETSTNLASVKMRPDEILVSTSQRSSYESSKKNVANMVASVFHLAGAKTRHGNGYPGWIPDLNSKILEITKKAYKDLFDKEPKVLAIHAGLECGIIGEKYPGMDMISFGPTIKGAHSPDERLEIDTVPKFWELTLEVLKNIPEK